MATEILGERTLATRSIGVNWFRVRNLLIFLTFFLICLLAGVVASLIWPVSYTSKVLVTAPHAGLQGDLNRAADLVASRADVLDNAAQLDASLRLLPKDMLTEFGVVFVSSDSLRDFYIDRQLYQLDGFAEADLSLQFLRAAGRFVDSFSLLQTNVAGVEALELAFTDKRAETAAELINTYVNYSADAAVRNLLNAQLEKKQLVLVQLQDYLELERRGLSGLAVNVQPARERIAVIEQLYRQLEELSIQAQRVRPVRLVSQATAELARPTPQPWLIVASAAVIGLILGVVLLLLLERREHEQ